MGLNELLAELQRRGVELVAVGDLLRYRPKEAVTLELRQAILAHKPQLLRLHAEAGLASRSRKAAPVCPFHPGQPCRSLRLTTELDRGIKRVYAVQSNGARDLVWEGPLEGWLTWTPPRG